MTETLNSNPEVLIETDQLPLGDELVHIYNDAFAHIPPPTVYEMPQDHRFEGQTLSVHDATSPYTSSQLQTKFVNQATRNAMANTWWVSAARALKNYAADPSDAEHIRLAAKHSLEVEYRGERTGQRYEVYELGKNQTDPEAAQVVFDTLDLIDQFTGGSFAADPRRPHIVLSNDIRFKRNPHGGGEGLGVAYDDQILLNVPGIKARADEVGADFHEFLAVATVHELLGHGLERQVYGGTGRYFPKFFEYSSETEQGEWYDKVHQRITSKEPVRRDSQPVREYGRVNAAEDLATSVDSSVAESMGWDETTTGRLPRWDSKVDPYRKELIMRLMDQAAQKAARHAANPGHVGAEVSYKTDGQGNVLGVDRLRKLVVETTDGATAIKQEIAGKIHSQQIDGPFVIYDENIF